MACQMQLPPHTTPQSIWHKTWIHCTTPEAQVTEALGDQYCWVARGMSWAVNHPSSVTLAKPFLVLLYTWIRPSKADRSNVLLNYIGNWCMGMRAWSYCKASIMCPLGAQEIASGDITFLSSRSSDFDSHHLHLYHYRQHNRNQLVTLWW